MDIGLEAPVSLHSEQSLVLKHLLDGANLAVSAPTSFGKSLIIDAYIAIRKPTNALILVPTIALTDETRRRLGRKFSAQYKIVTTVDVELGERNILIFPQERAIHYCDKLEKLDLLVVDEFYKASQDSTRSVPAAARQAAIRALEDGRSAGVSIPALCAAPVAQAFRWYGLAARLARFLSPASHPSIHQGCARYEEGQQTTGRNNGCDLTMVSGISSVPDHHARLDW